MDNDTSMSFPQIVTDILVIDETTKPLLTDGEIKEIVALGLSFGLKPEDHEGVFFLVSVESKPPHEITTTYQAMTENYIRMVFFTREIVEDLKKREISVLEDIKNEMANIETVWRETLYYR